MVLYHYEANNEQAGVCFHINKKWEGNKTTIIFGTSRVTELVLRITETYHVKIVKLYAPTTSRSAE